MELSAGRCSWRAGLTVIGFSGRETTGGLVLNACLVAVRVAD
jgi:hypothetical protein